MSIDSFKLDTISLSDIRDLECPISYQSFSELNTQQGKLPTVIAGVYSRTNKAQLNISSTTEEKEIILKAKDFTFYNPLNFIEKNTEALNFEAGLLWNTYNKTNAEEIINLCKEALAIEETSLARQILNKISKN